MTRNKQSKSSRIKEKKSKVKRLKAKPTPVDVKILEAKFIESTSELEFKPPGADPINFNTDCSPSYLESEAADFSVENYNDLANEIDRCRE